MFALLATAGHLSAQRLQVGFRGGLFFTDHHMAATEAGGMTVTQGPMQLGYDAGLMMRLNLTRHLHLHSEVNYVSARYRYTAATAERSQQIGITAERLEIPVQLGLQFGVVRLFGGAVFRPAATQHSHASHILRVKYNDNDIALTAGLGFTIQKFAFDFRVTGYPQRSSSNTLILHNATTEARVRNSFTYGLSLGFFF